MEYIIGVDVGATQLRAALVDDAGQIHAQTRVLTAVQHGPRAVIAQIVAAIADVRQVLPSNAALLGVGIGCPGPLDPEAGVVLAPPNLPGWHDVPLRDAVAQQVELPVMLDNDANAAALGEWLFGGGIGYCNLVYITVSTGIGSGVISDGRLLRGQRGAGGEFGQIIINVAGRQTWEDVASGTALGRTAARAMRANFATLLHTLATPETVSGAQVAQAALRGDPLAQRLMDDEAEVLGLGFTSLLHALSPEIILVGGSVITENPTLLVQAQAVVQARAIADVYRTVPIEVAHLGNQVGVLGAAALVLYQRKATA